MLGNSCQSFVNVRHGSTKSQRSCSQCVYTFYLESKWYWCAILAEAGSAKVLKDPDVDLSEWLRHWGTPGLPKLWPGWCHVVPRCPMLAQDGPMLHQGRPQDGFRNAPCRNMGAPEDHIGQSRNHFRAILRQDGTTLGSIIKNIEFRYVFSSSRFENVIFRSVFDRFWNPT